MKKILSFISTYFRVFFIAGIAIGFIFPKFSAQVEPYMDILLMGVMYLGCLKVEIKRLKNIGKWKKELSIYIIVSMLILPVLAYWGTYMIYPERAPGVFLLVAAPAGIASIALSSLVKGNTSLVATITLITSLVCIITIPLLSKVLLGSQVDIEIISIFQSLILRIIIPLIAAQVTKKYRNGWTILQDWISPLTILLVLPLIRGPIGIHKAAYTNLSREALIGGIIAVFIISILLHIIGRYIRKSSTHENKVAGSVGMGYMNVTLCLLLANNYFGPTAVLIMVLFELPRDLMLIPFARISKKLK